MCLYVKERFRNHYIVSIPATNQRRDYLALFSLRATVPARVSISTPSAHQQRDCFPLQFITGKIERIQGVSPFVLALNVLAGFLRSFSPSLYVARAPACPPSGFVRAVVIVTSGKRKKEEEKKKKRICRFSKAKRKDGSGPIC